MYAAPDQDIEYVKKNRWIDKYFSLACRWRTDKNQTPQDLYQKKRKNNV